MYLAPIPFMFPKSLNMRPPKALFSSWIRDRATAQPAYLGLPPSVQTSNPVSAFLSASSRYSTEADAVQTPLHLPRRDRFKIVLGCSSVEGPLGRWEALASISSNKKKPRVHGFFSTIVFNMQTHTFNQIWLVKQTNKTTWRQNKNLKTIFDESSTVKATGCRMPCYLSFQQRDLDNLFHSSWPRFPWLFNSPCLSTGVGAFGRVSWQVWHLKALEEWQCNASFGKNPRANWWLSEKLLKTCLVWTFQWCG